MKVNTIVVFTGKTPYIKERCQRIPQPFDTLHHTEISEVMCQAIRDYSGQIYNFVTQRDDVIETALHLSNQFELDLHLTRLQLDNPYSTSVSYTKEELEITVEHHIEVR